MSEHQLLKNAVEERNEKLELHKISVYADEQTKNAVSERLKAWQTLFRTSIECCP